MSVALARRLEKETLTLQRFDGRDGQGAPSYQSGVTFEARVEERDVAARAQGGSQYVVAPDGSQVRVALTLYVPGDETEIPDEQDRVVRGSAGFVVMERTEIRRLTAASGSPDHVRMRCRDE